MPFSRENMGVLREISVTKNVPTKIPIYQKHQICRDESVDLDKAFSLELENCTSMVNDLIIGDKKRSKKKSSMTFKKLETQISSTMKNMELNLAVVENSSISKMLAMICLIVSIVN